MSGCLDNVQCECGIDWREKRNTVASIVAGVLFWSGWWIIINIATIYPNDTFATVDPYGFRHAYYTCGVFSTVSLIMINAVSNSQVRGEAMTEGVLGTRGARLWLLIGFVIGFGSLIASMWILFQDFVVPGAANQWRGVALFLQNFLIFISSLLYKFGRTEDLWG